MFGDWLRITRLPWSLGSWSLSTWRQPVLLMLTVWLQAGKKFAGVLWLIKPHLRPFQYFQSLWTLTMAHGYGSRMSRNYKCDDLCCYDTLSRNLPVSTWLHIASCKFESPGWHSWLCSKLVESGLQGVLFPEIPMTAIGKSPTPLLFGAILLTKTPLPSPFSFFFQHPPNQHARFSFPFSLSNLPSCRKTSLIVWLLQEKEHLYIIEETHW